MKSDSEKNSSTPSSVPPSEPIPSQSPAPAALVAARVPEGSSVLTDAGRGEAPKGTAVREIGGPAGPEPTRFGDWERKGRCIDF